MKNAVFWDGRSCGSCKNKRIGGTYHLLQQADKNRFTEPCHPEDGGAEMLSPRAPAALYFPETSFSASGTQFYYSLSKTQDLVPPEVLGKLIKFNYLSGPEYETFRLVVCCPYHYATACPIIMHRSELNSTGCAENWLP
jgi:hypothetical protein